MEEKRKNFPRFYFLSNPDLLSLLSNQSDPKKVEIHLNKCFDGIVKLEQEENYTPVTLLAMVSGEGEKVPFQKNVQILKEKGIEQWLSEVMQSMI